MTHKIDDLSSLSTAEFIKLVGHYNTILNGKAEFDTSSLLAKGYSPEALEEARRQTERTFKSFESLGIRFTRPHDFKSDYLGYGWLLFENYERGVLPFPGSVSEQPAQIMELFGVFQALRTENQTRAQKKAELEAKRKGKKR